MIPAPRCLSSSALQNLWQDQCKWIFLHDSEAGSRSNMRFMPDPSWVSRSPTSCLSRTLTPALGLPHCQYPAPAPLLHTSGSSDGTSAVDLPSGPTGPSDPVHRPCPSPDGCSFALVPRRRPGPFRLPASVKRASPCAESRLRLVFAGLVWIDGGPRRWRWQNQILHPGVGVPGYRPLRSNVADAAAQSEPDFQIWDFVNS